MLGEGLEPSVADVTMVKAQDQPPGFVFQFHPGLLVLLILVLGVMDGAVDEDGNVHTVAVIGEVGPDVVAVDNLLSLVGQPEGVLFQ